MRIEFTKQVIFKDMNGTIHCVYNIGDIIEAYHDNGQYFVNSLGGIYHDEAKLVSEEVDQQSSLLPA